MKNKKRFLASWVVSVGCWWVMTGTDLFAQMSTSDYANTSAYAAIADSLVKIGQKEEALVFLLHSKDSLEKQGDGQSVEYLSVVRSLGFFYFDHRRGMAKARECLEEAAKILRVLEAQNKTDLAFVWHIIGKSYYFNGRPKQAYPYFEKSLPLWRKAFGEHDANTARCYNALALCYKEAGLYDKGIQYALKAIRSLPQHHPDLGAFLYNIGFIYLSRGDPDEALKYLEEALQAIEANGDDDDRALCLSMLGSTYASLGDGAKAVEYQKNALEMFEKIGDAGYVIACYQDLGRAYRVQHNYAQSLESYRAALVYGSPQEPRPDALLGMAYAYRAMNDQAAALPCLNSALSALGYTRPLRLDSLANRILTYRALLLKAAIMADKYAADDKNTEHLQYAGELLSDAQTIILNRIGVLYQDKNKLAFYHLAAEGNTQAIDVYTRLYAATQNTDWLRRAFEFAEINKSLLLYQMVLENKTRRQFAVPDSLSSAEEQLKKSIAETEKSLFDFSQKPPLVTISDSLQERLFALQNRYESLRGSIEAICPDYFAANAAFPRENIEAIQADLLDDSTALLEYFTSDSTLCIFLLRRDTFFFYQNRLLDSFLKKQVERMRWGLYAYFTAPEKTSALYLQTAQEYAESAFALYRLLIAPMEEKLPPKLIVVPDGVLNYLPFEALLATPPSRADRFEQHRYLMLRHDISYCFSAALLREMKNAPPPTASGALLAMAPFYEKAGVWSDSAAMNTEPLRAALRPLPHSGEEARKIAKLTKGRAVVGSAATKAEFVRLAPGFRILHLATHGRANDRAGEFSFLAFPALADSFEAEQLTASEIYNLRLNADLVTLSACETGLGTLHRGEGIIGLSRAFASAGAKSILHSLWTVNDAATKTLMEYFYQNLRRGLPKDAALRQAKLSFLRQFKGESAHPFFWSGFVLLGDSSPLSF